MLRSPCIFSKKKPESGSFLSTGKRPMNSTNRKKMYKGLVEISEETSISSKTVELLQKH